MVRQNVMIFLRYVCFLRENKRFRTNLQSRFSVSQLVLCYSYVYEPYQRIRRWHWCRFTRGESQFTLWLRGWSCFTACLDDLEEGKICWPYRELNFTSSATRLVVLFWYTITVWLSKLKKTKKLKAEMGYFCISPNTCITQSMTFYQYKKYEFPMKHTFIYCRHDHTRSMYFFLLCHITCQQAYKIIRTVTAQCSALVRK